MVSRSTPVDLGVVLGDVDHIPGVVPHLRAGEGAFLQGVDELAVGVAQAPARTLQPCAGRCSSIPNRATRTRVDLAKRDPAAPPMDQLRPCPNSTAY